MTILARLLGFALLAAFLAGSVAQVAAAGTMSAQMSSVIHSQMDGAASCPGCDGEDDDHATCGCPCVSAQAVIEPFDDVTPAPLAPDIHAAFVTAVHQRAEPPARTPPRSLS